jgi:hypothetical protein
MTAMTRPIAASFRYGRGMAVIMTEQAGAPPG